MARNLRDVLDRMIAVAPPEYARMLQAWADTNLGYAALVVVVAMLLCVGGCETTGATADCAPPLPGDTVHYTQDSDGTCGDNDSEEWSSWDDWFEGCTDTPDVRVDSDACTARVSCILRGPGATATFVGTAAYPAEGRPVGTIVVRVTQPDGTVSCESFYEVAWERR